MLMDVSLDLKDVSVSKTTTEELIMNKRTTPERKNTTEGRKVYTLVQMNGVRFFSRLRETWATNHTNLGKDMSNHFFPACKHTCYQHLPNSTYEACRKMEYTTSMLFPGGRNDHWPLPFCNLSSANPLVHGISLDIMGFHAWFDIVWSVFAVWIIWTRLDLEFHSFGPFYNVKPPR